MLDSFYLLRISFLSAPTPPDKKPKQGLLRMDQTKLLPLPFRPGPHGNEVSLLGWVPRSPLGSRISIADAPASGK
jgi:hypothetical protein